METKVKGVLQDKYEVDNIARKHIWKSDEPIDKNGADSGPKPTELLLSSLVSCKLITLRMYSERKGWIIDGLKLTLELVGEENDSYLVKKEIIFPDNLDEEQKKRLTLISTKCPIAKMLSSSLIYV